MNFLEAVRELREGRCEGIKRLNGVSRQISPDGEIDNSSFFADSILADDWQLVNPTPQYEPVEETVKVGIYNNGEYIIDPAIWLNDLTLVDAKLTFQRPVKPKVKHRKYLGKACDRYLNGHVLTGDEDIYAEWYGEEQP